MSALLVKEDFTASKRAVREQGLLSNFFHNPIAEWGSHNRVLSIDSFKRTSGFSKEVALLFKELKREEVSFTAKGFQVAIADIWEIFSPREYNTVMAGYQFFREYVLTGYNFQIIQDLNILNRATKDLQRNFAYLLQYDQHEKILTESLPAYLANSRRYSPLAPALHDVMQYLMQIKKSKPCLKDVFIALWTMLHERIFSWEEICQKLNVEQAVVDSYSAPSTVKDRILQRSKYLQMEYKKAVQENSRLNCIRERYLQVDENENASSQFLEPIIKNALRNCKGRQTNDSMISVIQKQPHQLLFMLMKDFDATSLVLLEDKIAVHHLQDGRRCEVMLPRAVFEGSVKRFNQLMRQVELFYKRYTNMSYSFAEYRRDMELPRKTAHIEMLHELIKKFNRLFDTILTQIETLLGDHESRQYISQSGKVVANYSGKVDHISKMDHVNKKDSFPEKLDSKATLLQLEEFELISNSRFAGKTIHFVLQEIVAEIYNYLYIFRYGKLIQSLEECPQKEKRLDNIRSQSNRLGVNLDHHLDRAAYNFSLAS